MYLLVSTAVINALPDTCNIPDEKALLSAIYAYYYFNMYNYNKLSTTRLVTFEVKADTHKLISRRDKLI